MEKNSWGDIVSDGFVCSYGRFRTQKGNAERIEGSKLRAMFLPNVSQEGRRTLAKDGPSFVRSQLMHYGVEIGLGEFSGKGATLMKRTLLAGKCDTVPDHITALRERMHAEWLDSISPEMVSDHPEFAMDKYFLTAGRPDRTKTTTLVGIPLDRYSTYRLDNMRKAAEKVQGLHCAAARGPKTQTVFMGWDEEAVQQAASEHPDKEAAAVQAAEKKREEERNKLHNEYLESLRGKDGPKSPSPIGHYMVDCKEIEEGWDDVKDLTLDIMETNTPGIFQAVFDFGILKGVFLMCEEETKLREYVSQLDSGGESSSDEDDEEEGDSLGSGDGTGEGAEEMSDTRDNTDDGTLGSKTGMKKRKSVTSPVPDQPRKKPNTTAGQPFQYFIRLRCRETGEGELYSLPEKGTLVFRDMIMAAFSGAVDLPCVGSNVPFSARKISNVPKPHKKSWSDYYHDY